MSSAEANKPTGIVSGELPRPQIPVEVVREGGIATVRMHTDRSTQPPNAITSGIWDGLYNSFAELSRDSTTRIIVLRGASGRFGSGADFHEVLEVLNSDEKNGNDRGAHDYWRLVNYAHTAIEHCPQPVIAMIDGYALGAACALAMACDLRVAADNARVGIPAVQRGLTLGLADTRRLVSKVGAANASEILLLGRMYSGDEARRVCLVNFTFPADKLDEEVMRIARAIATENAPLAMEEAKVNIRTVMQNPVLAGIDGDSFPIKWAGSQDLREGIGSFIEKREPNFKGN